MENYSHCSELPRGFLPKSEEYFHSLTTGYIVALSLCLVMTLITVASYGESVIFLMRNLHNWKPRDKAIWLLALYPVLCATSFIGLMVPRSATLNDMVAALYLSLCVYLFVVMLMGHFGGQHKMSKRLASGHMNLQSPPMCCCCVCLPSIKVSTFRLRVLEFSVLQFAILRPILAYLAAVMWSNGKYISEDLVKDSSYTWINVTNIISTLLALYGFSIVYQLSRVPLQKMSVRPKFLVLQLVMIISTFQHVIISIFVVSGVIPCEGMLTAKGNGDRWHHMIYIFEIFVTSWFARHYYRRHVGDMDPEEQIVTDTADNETMTTATLQRQINQSKQYGAFTDQRANTTQTQSTNRYSLPNGVPSVSTAVSYGTNDDSAKIIPNMTSTVSTNPSSSAPALSSSTSGNEMEDFIHSIFGNEQEKKRGTPVSSMSVTGSDQQTQQSKGSQQVATDVNQVKLEMADEGTQSEA